MEQNANALPKVTLGQYKGLEFTRRVRPVSEKAVELEAANLTRMIIIRERIIWCPGHIM